MLAEQAAAPGRLTVDVVTFDDKIETQQTMAPVEDVTIALEPRGMTALHDAERELVTQQTETPLRRYRLPTPH